MSFENNQEKKIQGALIDFFKVNKYSNMLLKYAGIILYIYVAKLILGVLPLPSVLSNILNCFSAIIYFLYIAGLLLCYSKNEMMPIFVVFAAKTVLQVVSIIRVGFYFNGIIYFLVYGILTYFTFERNFQSSSNLSISDDENKLFCSECGSPINENTAFCGNCGTKQK